MSTLSTKNVCRTCLAEDSTFESLFTQDKNSDLNINFAEMIMFNSTIQIIQGDGLPEQICCECSRKIEELHKFIIKCEESDSILRSQITCLNKTLEDEKSRIMETVLEEPSYSSDSKRGDFTKSDENHICEVCFKGFKCKNVLLEHKKLHNMVAEETKTKRVKKELQECDLCSKKFSKLSNLKRHQLSHVKKPHVCNECGRSYKFENNLLQHLKVHMGMKPHVCSVCNKGFNQKSNLRDHLRTHNGEKPFLCSTCGKGFNHLGNLKQHAVRHTGIKAHLCSMCGIGFASKGELGSHIRKHTGAHPFICDICNSGFTTSSSLTKHKRIHSGEKPYECEVCNMKFSRSGILARHRKTHTGEKPHDCKYCEKKFTQKNDLRLHLMVHTGEKPFICDVCGKAFRQPSTLKYHIKTHINKKGIDMALVAKPELYLTTVKIENTCIEGF